MEEVDAVADAVVVENVVGMAAEVVEVLVAEHHFSMEIQNNL